MLGALRRIILVGILICYIAAAAIELGKWSANNVGTNYRVWPSWGWICAIVAGLLWFFAGSFAACEFSESLPSLARPHYTCHSIFHADLRHRCRPAVVLCGLSRCM